MKDQFMNRSRLYARGAAYRFRYAPNGEYLVSLGRAVVVWSSRTAQRVTTSTAVTHPFAIDFCPARPELAIKSTQGVITVVSLPDLAPINVLTSGVLGEGAGPMYSICGAYLIDGAWEGVMQVRHIQSAEVVWSHRHDHAMVTAMAAPADRSSFIYAVKPKAKGDEPPGASMLIRRAWPFGAGPGEVIPHPFEDVRAISVDRDGSLMAVVHADATAALQLSILSLADSRVTFCTSLAQGGTGTAVASSPNGSYLAVTDGDGVLMFDATRFALIERIEVQHPADVSFSPDSAELAIGTWSAARTVRVVPP